MQEAALRGPALRLVPDDVERLARLGERALDQVVVVRRQRRAAAACRARGAAPAGARAGGGASSAGSRRRRPRGGSGRAAPRRGSRRRTGRPAAGRGRRGSGSGCARRACARAPARSAVKRPGSQAPRPAGRRGSRRRRGTGSPRRPRAAPRRGSSGGRVRSRVCGALGSARSRAASRTRADRRGTTGRRARCEDARVIEGKRVAVVVPAFNEEELLPETLAGIPGFVDRIVVVDDASSDGTVERARAAAAADPRIEVVERERNGGVGAAIVTGYKRALEERVDVTCVMAGDNQMDPDDLAAIVAPVARGEVDYAKANRLFTRPGVGADPAPPLPRQRRPLAADEDRVGLLARRRLAVRLHRDRPPDARAARPRPDLHALRVPERPARAPERVERASPRRPVAPGVRRRRALGHPPAPRRAGDLVAALQGASGGGSGRST